MRPEQLFEQALGITASWTVTAVDFDVAARRLTVWWVDFPAASAIRAPPARIRCTTASSSGCGTLNTNNLLGHHT